MLLLNGQEVAAIVNLLSLKTWRGPFKFLAQKYFREIIMFVQLPLMSNAHPQLYDMLLQTG